MIVSLVSKLPLFLGKASMIELLAMAGFISFSATLTTVLIHPACNAL